jgi:nucleotide-binding universal stress UspA family protein
MFQRILVPLDGSPRAERAIPVAAQIARASAGTVLLVRVTRTAAALWSSDPTPTALPELERYLTETRAARSLAGLATASMALSGGPAALTILHAAHTAQADLIVLCSHGYRGTTRLVLGSVAQQVANQAVVPVLILSEEGPVPVGPQLATGRPLRALVPQDGSALAMAALEPAACLIAALAAPAPGALHLAWVVDPAQAEREGHQPTRAVDHEPMLDAAKRQLHGSAKQLHARLAARGADLTLTITWSVTLGTDVASTLVSLAENGEERAGANVSGACAVMAMATHGPSGMQRGAIGSITQRVLNATRLPLLVVRPWDSVERSHLIWDEATITTLLAWS